MMHRMGKQMAGVAMSGLLLLGSTGLFAAEQAVELSGVYFRGKNTQNGQPLKMTLSPIGDRRWKVAYDFQWSGKDRTWTGEVTGDLRNGEVIGSAADEKGKRTWEIKGSFKDGVLTFEHWETTKGKRSRSGSATLK